MLKTLAASFAVALSTLAHLSPSSASAVAYKFSGTVDSVDAPISSEFQVNELVSGHMSLTLLVAESDRAFYSVSDFYANIGGDYSITSSSPNNSFNVLNNFGGSADLVGLHIYLPDAAPVSGYVPDYFNFNLRYKSANDLNSTDLLPQFIFGAPLDRSNLRFDVNDAIEVRFILTDLSVVPEPSTYLLGTLALLGLLAFRRGR